MVLPFHIGTHVAREAGGIPVQATSLVGAEGMVHYCAACSDNLYQLLVTLHYSVG